MKFKFLNVLFLLAIIFISSLANAGLIDRGNGMIYDDYLDITWLADANYSVTSGYAGINTTGALHSDPNNIQINGQMGWNAASTWAAQLVFEGYDDWRLVSANPYDTNCDGRFVETGYPDQSVGRSCIESELGHLFYEDLNVRGGYSILTSVNLNLFKNVQHGIYWTSTEYEPNTNLSFLFDTKGGSQVVSYKPSSYFAWAVRDGDVYSVPEPSTLAIFALALMGLATLRKRESKL
jgi:hypothetical protein